MKHKELSKMKTAKEVLCEECKTHKYKVVKGYPRKDYGEIVFHKEGCSKIKLDKGLEV